VNFLYFFLFFCLGCTEVPKKERELTSLKENATEFQEICRRIGKLDMTAVALSSGISESTANRIRDLSEEFGINIPGEALVNKRIFAAADTDDHRLDCFLDACNSKQKIIWVIRGGYGAARVIAPLSCLPKPKVSKTLVGFSDITAMNLFISQKWPSWRVIHATVLVFLNKNSFKNKFETLLDILEGKIDSYEINGIYPLNDKAMPQKSITGKLTGGNLSIIQTSIKTAWEIQTEGKILFVEDNYEAPERIYRAMYHLREAGKFAKVKALVFGHFYGAGDPKRLRLFLKGFAQTLNIPVFVTDKFGHGVFNEPLVYNAEAEIHDNKMTVRLK
jgi:muramoyltetrapeptide carboxypeptidase